jgi:hypothetical protein
MPFDDKNNLRHLAFKPLHLATMTYPHWLEKRQLAQEILETQRQIATVAGKKLLHFHEELWSHWPDAAQHVRQHVRREENTHEQ